MLTFLIFLFCTFLVRTIQKKKQVISTGFLVSYVYVITYVICVKLLL